MRNRILLGVFLAVIAVSLVWVLTKILPTTSQSPSGAAVAIIIGAACLVVVVLLITVIFAWLGLADYTQALALPEGSIRALIALILLSAFISVPLYLYNNIDGATKFVDGIPAAAKADTIASLPKGSFLFAVPTGEKEAQLFRIYYRDVNPVKDDFAKEILTAMITLVSSVCSFYFGAAVAKSAQAAGAAGVAGGSPVLSTVMPSKSNQGSTVTLDITGGNLELVNRVTLTNGTAIVDATAITSNSGLIKCTFALPAAPGKWTLAVATSDRKTARLENAFEIQ